MPHPEESPPRHSRDQVVTGSTMGFDFIFIFIVFFIDYLSYRKSSIVHNYMKYIDESAIMIHTFTFQHDNYY